MTAKKVLKFLFFGFLFFPLLSFYAETSESEQENNFMQSLGQELQQIWPHNSCMYYLAPSSAQDDYDFFSLACTGSFDENDRQKFLDVMYRRQLYLKEENKRANQNDIFYLYRFDASFLSRPLFMKVYFRAEKKLRAVDVSRQKLPKMALFVSGLTSQEQLLQWQQLGIPLQYTVNPYSTNAHAVSEKIFSYHQGLWLDIPYESRPPFYTYTPALTVEQAKQPQKLKNYLDNVFGRIVFPTGVVCGRGNYFSQDTFAVRKLMQALKEKKVPFILDIDSKNKIAYGTADVLQQKAYLLDVAVKNNMQNVWQELVEQGSKRQNSFWIVEVRADDQQAYEFLLQKVRNSMDSMTASYPFVLLPLVAD